MGFGSVTRFIDHLYTQWATTSNYSITANLHILQITTASAKRFPACYVFTSHSLAVASDWRFFSFTWPGPLFTASRVELPNSLAYNILAQTTQKPPFSTVTLLLCVHLLQREHIYRAVGQKQSLFTESLPSIGFI
jgi:hypothetical protein